MAMKYNGPTLDIHCGGTDHIRVHHTNEIAQSECANGVQFSRFWMHGEFLRTASEEKLEDGTIEQKFGKMSKSSGEFLTVTLLMERGFNPLDYRYFALGSHYRNYLNFTWEALTGAKEAFKSLHKKTDPLIGKATAITSEAAKAFQQEFKDAIGDDLNMPRALGIMNTMLKSDIDDGEKAALVADFDKIFGLKLDQPREEYVKKGANDNIDTAKIEALIAARKEARANKNWAESDRIRDELAAMNIVIKDSKEGTTWSVKE
jgi:cysteinyl-tRNA synthetase